MVLKIDLTKTAQIDQLRQEILNQKVCETLSYSASQLVMGGGDLDAKVMFIGEAPGKREDQLGQPFVGASGKFLDQLLLSIGLKREQVYVTNIVKYRPPNNRDPLPQEKAEFSPYLLKQIKIINPQVIVTLGRHSLSFFLPNARISEVHGQLYEFNISTINLQIIPLYHPAAALYNGGMRQQLMSDFMVIKQFI